MLARISSSCRRKCRCMPSFVTDPPLRSLLVAVVTVLLMMTRVITMRVLRVVSRRSSGVSGRLLLMRLLLLLMWMRLLVWMSLLCLKFSNGNGFHRLVQRLKEIHHALCKGSVEILGRRVVQALRNSGTCITRSQA